MIIPYDKYMELFTLYACLFGVLSNNENTIIIYNRKYRPNM